jgi:hypothetical protein
MKTSIALGLIVLLGAGPAAAEEQFVEGTGQIATLGFVEATGAYGFQLGEQEYLPTSSGAYEHPMTNGFAVGLSAGWEFVEDLALVGNWQWASSNSRNGQVPDVMRMVEGTIEYHTLAIGLRWTKRLGPGRLIGELGGGVILPFETVVHYDYADGMSGVLGVASGHQIDEYNLGFGAQGQLGYQWDIAPRFYVAAALDLRSFQSGNIGRQTRYEDVLEVTAEGPQLVNAVIQHEADKKGAGIEPPSTYSVQDLRLQIGLGFRL